MPGQRDRCGRLTEQTSPKSAHPAQTALGVVCYEPLKPPRVLRIGLRLMPSTARYLGISAHLNMS